MKNLLLLVPILMLPHFVFSQISGHEKSNRNVLADTSLIATTPSPAPTGMVLIPKGEFWMGRVHFFLVDAIGWVERDRLDNTPAHRVKLDSFHIDQNEVTNDNYSLFVKVTDRDSPWQWQGGSVPKGHEQYPVYNVSWNDANDYCRWAGKRLPTEAEWEKAARGGLDRKKFSWGNEGMGLEGYEVNSESMVAQTGRRAHTNYPFGPAPVRSYPPNGYLVYEMSGNLWEWVDDWYYRNYYSISPLENPTGPEKGKYKVFRGGGWSDTDERNLMNHFRSYADPEVRSTTVGFRCAQSIAKGETRDNGVSP